MCNLIQKYNVPGPRYTSYPTVPYWNLEGFSGRLWKSTVNRVFHEKKEEGISVYVHLPFCERMCTFCGCHKRITKRHDVELPYIKSVLKEWQMYVKLLGEKPKIKELHLGGGTPTFFSPENLSFLVTGILQNASITTNPEFSFEGHPNNTTKEHLKALFNVGFKRVCFGVQDYNATVQKAINRIQPFAHVRQVTEWAREIGYTSVGHDIIYGLPFQQLRDVEHTVLMTQALRPDRIAFYSYAHVPWIKGNGQRGYRDEDIPSGSEKRTQYGTGKKMLEGFNYKNVGMDHFALPNDTLYRALVQGKLHRNFMGYTPSSTRLLIGLGASSISDSWYGFAQNVKNIEEYQNLTANDILPIFRGHILTQEDKLIRKHILELMCQFETILNPKTQKLGAFQHIKENLIEMESDGLILCEGDHLKVTSKGKPYIRNICMSFDLKLYRKKPETPLFSMTV